MKPFVIIFMFLPSVCFAQTPKIDYLIFGVYCGECVGHCATMYKIEQEKVTIDTSNRYFWHNLTSSKDTAVFRGCEGTDEMYMIGKVLIDSVPKILLDTNTHSCTFGGPDDRDQCGIYLEFKYLGKRKKFYIDTDTRDLPSWLLSYQALMQSTERRFARVHWCK